MNTNMQNPNTKLAHQKRIRPFIKTNPAMLSDDSDRVGCRLIIDDIQYSFAHLGRISANMLINKLHEPL